MANRVLTRARPALCAVVVAWLLSASPLLAQVGAPSGPGQAVPQPPPQCPATVGCTYGERNFLPNGYEFQQLEVCGANCTTQYWISSLADGSQLLVIDPVRGGGVVAVGRTTPQYQHPPVRTFLPNYQSGDPACCPSQYADTTYTWNAGSGTLVAAPSIVPAANFTGWDDVRSDFQTQQFTPVF
jgi:hypothetical protein